MRLFVRVVERRSFAQAARDLQIPRTTVTYAIKHLEERLGTLLLNRTTRQVRPTADGTAYYERCVRLLADLDETESAFRHVNPQGLLRIDLQGTIASFFVLPVLPQFMECYPGIVLRLSETDRLIDLIEEGVDCVLRAGEPQDSSLVGKRVACFEWVTCASPAYLERFGTPHTLDDLAMHKMIGYLASTGQPYPLEFCVGDELELVELPTTLNLTGASINAAAGLAGLGLVQLPRFKIQQTLDTGALKVVLPDLPPPPQSVWVLYPQSRALSPRVRVFIDWLTGVFAKAGFQAAPKTFGDIQPMKVRKPRQ